VAESNVKRFDVVDHTADAGIVSYGRDLREAFANAAHGMFSLIAEAPEGTEDFSRQVDIQSPDREALLVDWLNELIFIFEMDHAILSSFEVDDISENRLRARVGGQRIDPARHRLKTEVKAATYHSLRIDEGNGFTIRVILDM
jgi:SHS2 domain-containing protein